MMGKQQRSKKTSVMERYEMDAPDTLGVAERWHIGFLILRITISY